MRVHRGELKTIEMKRHQTSDDDGRAFFPVLSVVLLSQSTGQLFAKRTAPGGS